MHEVILPRLLFTSQRAFDDFTCDDMKYGDLSATQLKTRFELGRISDQVDPWTLTRLLPFDAPQSRFSGSYPPGRGEKISVKTCTDILFDEMRHTSWPFSFMGNRCHLINMMLNHMQTRNGAPFRDPALDEALRQQVLSDNSPVGTRIIIKDAFEENFVKEPGSFPNNAIHNVPTVLMRSHLPKFTRKGDSVNGLGISVHDIHATRIWLISLTTSPTTWRAELRYECQDHFGLDENDISQLRFNQFHFFRIWFVLQHYHAFSFKPFLTNMSATIEIQGKTR
ncbi:DUF3289 family protein [Siccibacter turicensis]|uniref:DUF3289 family protein n=1 Tax=Siccibacter turicensis TaxID=357233 RepID=UPI003F5768E9